MRNPRAARRPGGFASLAQEFEHSRRARAMSSGSAFSDAGMSINSEALGSSEASTIDDGWNRLSPGHAPESSLVTDKFPERHPVGLTSMPLSSPPPPPPQPLSRASDNAERERTPPSSHHQRDTWGSSPTGSDAESHTDSLGLGNFSPDSSMAALSPTSPASSFASMSPEPEHKAAAAMPSMHTVLDTPPVTRARSTSQSQGGHPPETIIFPIPPGRGFSRPKELRNVLSDPTHAPVLAQCEETCGPGQFAQAKLLLCSAERRELPDRALLERVAQAFGLVDHHSHSSSSTHPSPSPSSRTREEQDRIDDMLCEESYPLKWKAFARFCEVLCIAPQDIAEARKRCGPLPGSGSGSQHGVDA